MAYLNLSTSVVQIHWLQEIVRTLDFIDDVLLC